MLMNAFVLLSLLPFVEQIARAGGGGSGGGGGGGGSGSGVGGLVFIGYIVMYYLAKPFKKFFSRSIAFAITIPIAAVLSIGVLVFMIVSGSFTAWWFGTEFIIGVWIGWTGQMFSIWDKMKKKFKKADDDLVKAEWNEDELKQVASQAFLRYQNDWSRRDSSHFAEYMTPYYAAHATLMVQTLTELHRFDLMENVQILQMDTSAVYDNPDDSQDFFSMIIQAKANDRLVEEGAGKVLHTDNSAFVEEWTFQRNGSSWSVAGIRQTTEAPGMMETDLKQFAQANNMFYSLDMGWLFLPTRGDIFNNGKWIFGFSDVNNHVIGVYNKHLIQLYTYVRAQGGQQDARKNYLVGQINVPKSYGGILIERKKGLIKRMFAPKGYQKYELEWPDFNNRYAVYATDQSRLATFELLNPGFMAYLYDNFNDVSIEVVDNIIYFYVLKTGMRSDYEQLMQLLMKAFKELQL